MGLNERATQINGRFQKFVFWDEVLNLASFVVRAATFISALVGEDCEHHTTKQFAGTTDLWKCPNVILSESEGSAGMQRFQSLKTILACKVILRHTHEGLSALTDNPHSAVTETVRTAARRQWLTADAALRREDTLHVQLLPHHECRFIAIAEVACQTYKINREPRGGPVPKQ